ncbi:MAG: twin-arginine translocase subunit TatC [Planctomycetaceae bacterium]
MNKSKDLFDDSTMSFGEHLEILRVHLWKAIIGVVIAVVVCLFFSNDVTAFVREPVDRGLTKLYFPTTPYDELPGFDPRDYVKYHWGWLGGWPGDDEKKSKADDAPELPSDTIAVQIPAGDLYKALKSVSPDSVKDPPEKTADDIQLHLKAREFEELKSIRQKQAKPITLTVQEAFMMYLKVAMIAGFGIASPWVFYQLWLFVAAGLYQHEKKYVYRYLPMSFGLFLSGALFCFYFVIPIILEFLLKFNEGLEVTAQIRLSEWISFAAMLPIMFGISFQLPLVMLFLERLSIFSTDDYRAKRRMAILVIAVISMLLTPADPMSMLMMMFPLIILYELGIVLCGMRPAASSPFEEAPA